MNINNVIKQRVIQHLSNERRTLHDFVYNEFSKINSINNPLVYNANKLIILELAKSVGLLVPPTYISSDFKDLPKTFEKQDLITKNIQDILIHIDTDNNYQIAQSTQPVKMLEKNANDNFFMSLFQENISKKFELRIFYLEDEFYAAAIFSQMNKSTENDFREDDKDKPNRVLPYHLSKELKDKLYKLTIKAKINCGSIDMIVTGENEFYFLEINPVGQLDWVSSMCNFNVERKLAKMMKEWK